MRTILTSEDLKNIVDNMFNGNLWASKYSNNQISYANPNSEKIILVDEDQEGQQYDLAQYLNIKFYNWKNRIVEQSEREENFAGFDDWVNSLNFSFNEAYALVEQTDEEITTSQDIDSCTKTAKITFIMQSNKIHNLEYYISKLRNVYIGNPQVIQNSFGDKITAYIMLGVLSYDQEPITTQIGETLIVSCYFRITYLNEALTYNDTEFYLSFKGDEYDAEGERKQGTYFYKVPLIKATIQNVFQNTAVPTANRPDLTGFVASSVACPKTLTFYDFKDSEITKAFDKYFWEVSAYRIGADVKTTHDINIQVFVKVVRGSTEYVFKDMIDSMEKVFVNNDFTVSSITLKGWGKLAEPVNWTEPV